MPDFGIDPVSIDVGHLVRRNVASLYSSLVTRPTGQAVRLAIENVLAEETGRPSLSVIDLSQVTIIDFSCADEVVAKLLSKYLGEERPRDAFFLFRGIKDLHRDPIEVVLGRQSLAAAAETEPGSFQLIGAVTEIEREVWNALEERGRLKEEEVDGIIHGGRGKETLRSLSERRLVLRSPVSCTYRSLSSLLRDLA